MPNEIIFHAYSAKWYYILAWIIRIKTNSKVDHCSVEIPGYGIYEAKLFSGVTVSHEHKKEPVKSITLPFDSKSIRGKQLINFYNHLVRKRAGYDYLAAIFGFFGYKTESRKRWYCSELTDLYFKLYLGVNSYFNRTTISPKTFLAKCEAYSIGFKDGQRQD